MMIGVGVGPAVAAGGVPEQPTTDAAINSKTAPTANTRRLDNYSLFPLGAPRRSAAVKWARKSPTMDDAKACAVTSLHIGQNSRSEAKNRVWATSASLISANSDETSKPFFAPA